VCTWAERRIIYIVYIRQRWRWHTHLSRRQAPPAVSGKYDPVIHIITDGSVQGCVVWECVCYSFRTREKRIPPSPVMFCPPKTIRVDFPVKRSSTKVYRRHRRKGYIIILLSSTYISVDRNCYILYIKYKNFAALKYMVYCVCLRGVYFPLLLLLFLVVCRTWQ